jgi:hypothetical protein
MTLKKSRMSHGIDGLKANPLILFGAGGGNRTPMGARDKQSNGLNILLGWKYIAEYFQIYLQSTIV